MSAESRGPIIVLAAVVERDGRFLVTRRLDHGHLPGLWEFPGGKCEPGESHDACLARIPGGRSRADRSTAYFANTTSTLTRWPSLTVTFTGAALSVSCQKRSSTTPAGTLSSWNFPSRPLIPDSSSVTNR